MAATMHASRSMSVANSRTTKAAAARFARVGQRAVRASRSSVVVNAGQCQGQIMEVDRFLRQLVRDPDFNRSLVYLLT